MINFPSFPPHLAGVAVMVETVFMPKWGEVLIFRSFLPFQWEKFTVLN